MMIVDVTELEWCLTLSKLAYYMLKYPMMYALVARAGAHLSGYFNNQ